MSRRRRMLLGGGVAIALVIAALAIARPGRTPVPSALPTGSGGLLPAATSTAPPSGVAPTQTPSLSAAPTPVPSNAVQPSGATAAPRTTGDPRLAYAAFLLRVNDD